MGPIVDGIVVTVLILVPKSYFLGGLHCFR